MACLRCPLVTGLACLPWLAAQTPQSFNLALGRVPIGSSDSYGASFAHATDGNTTQGSWWRASEDDYPSYLLLDLGAPAIATSMNITGGDSGFKTLKIYTSGDGVAWKMARQDNTALLCIAGSTTEHAGWNEPARYVAIQMEDRCSGLHVGRFSIAEWGVYGRYDRGMVQKYAKTWPHCVNLGDCFQHVDLVEVQATCLANSAATASPSRQRASAAGVAVGATRLLARKTAAMALAAALTATGQSNDCLASGRVLWSTGSQPGHGAPPGRGA
eukprot:CAMPEP_0179117964 /NCGR_PEP_ID=MMETSP0796-20121207/55441_1 /TAXON_ID=73915 /ORGANISM="Pyrodinium bahamense, Strain pbaha01" /LENGTH=271 /DNA_ID=CAMNT_0020816371 /DNA_START=35 /DNA_END=847 /DNA_ORIENTATION=+